LRAAIGSGKIPSRMNTPELREQCAQKLLAGEAAAKKMSAFIGLDGFVDEILHVVDKRDSAESFQRLNTISKLGERISAAAGQSTNIEIVNRVTKLGGNGPIMGNALVSFGLKVTYLGCLGWPNLHPVFVDFSKVAEVHSIAEPGHTDALEFDDGKVMLGKHSSLKDVNWTNIQSRFGRDKFAEKFSTSDLVGFVNWTMLSYMGEIWEAALREICPAVKGERRTIFFDLADPEKRKPEDIRGALGTIAKFEKYLDVILGLNEKEAYEIGDVLGLNTQDKSPEGLSQLALEINRRVPVSTLLVHPVSYALAASNGVVSLVEGPFTAKPLITTGAGDHFNSGFCLGKLLGLDNTQSVLTGVATSGHYVRTAKSPNISDLAKMLRAWPASEK
jgi:sugar/nucleoside kinase (ribokinase family)